jgi:hypothetical protein
MLLLFSYCCSLFEQNDFVMSKIILDDTNEKIYYDVFQTGIDNYRFDFKAISNSDTTKLFDYYLNDATYTAMKLNSLKTADTLIIKVNLPTNNTIAKTTNGTVVIFTKE